MAPSDGSPPKCGRTMISGAFPASPRLGTRARHGDAVTTVGAPHPHDETRRSGAQPGDKEASDGSLPEWTQNDLANIPGLRCAGDRSPAW